jgi:hypothetical protein
MTRAWCFAAVLALGVAGCSAEDADASLTIENASSYTLVEIYLSPVDAESWGSDLLGSELLEPGDILEVSAIACDVYDILVTDETGADCVLTDVDLCLDDALWTITDEELVACDLGR